jgi:uncharacterized protein DUF3606
MVTMRWPCAFIPSPLLAVSLPSKNRDMPDDKTKTSPQDASRINVHEKYEVEYWSKKFGVTPDQLKSAVAKVGVSASVVEKELGRR